jgi:tripartite-type tricarboxylate transporter receptor subunit TctC
VRIVVPFAPAGTTDILARAIAPELSKAFGQTFFVDNKPGAGGNLGAENVAKSPADGYTLLMGTVGTHGINRALYEKMPYDPIKDFAPITLVANSVGFVLAARPDLPAKNLKELLSDAKANPGKYTFGSGGVGNVMHFAGEFLASSADVKMTHVPFKGVSQSLNDLVAGRIDFVIGAPTAVLPLIKAGKLKALAITARKRWSELPDVPTIDEAAVKGFVYTPWYGFWFPAGTPPEHVTRMRTEVNKLLEEPEIKRVFAEQGFATAGSSSAEFGKVIADEIAMNKKLATRVDFTQ